MRLLFVINDSNTELENLFSLDKKPGKIWFDHFSQQGVAEEGNFIPCVFFPYNSENVKAVSREIY